MKLKVVKMLKGTPHLQTVWAAYIRPNSAGQTDADIRRLAQERADNYNKKLVIDHAWYLRNCLKGSPILDHDAWGVIWEEFVENEFGLEIP